MGKRSRERRLRRAETAPPRERADRSRAPASSPAAPARGLDASRGPAGDLATFWRDHGGAAVALFVLALVVRASLLVQISGTPFVHVHNIDSEAYHHWALRIAAGQWLPAETFYQSPFYAYYLATLYTLFGAGTWSPRIVQVVLGSLNAVLVYAIGARLFSRRVGWLAGIGLALYGPIILEEITVSKTTLLVVTSLGGFALYLWKAPRGRTRGLLAAGALFGISVVGVGQWLLPFLALVAWMPVMAGRLPPAGRRRATAAFAAGGLAVILPLTAWNSAKGGGLLLTSGDAGLNFYLGNNERASGLPAKPVALRDVPQYEEADARRLAEQAVGHPLGPAGVARYWSGQGLAWITRHPADWVVLLGKKLITLWNAFEIPDNYHYAFMRAHFLPLLWPLVTFALVAPLALVGLALPFWRRADVTALYVVCGFYLATVLVFYVRGRYRIPAVPFLIVFAAVAVDRLIRAVNARRFTAVAGLGAGLVAAGVLTNHEYCEAAHHDVPAVCLGVDSWFDSEWLKLSQWYLDNGAFDRAARYVERAAECTRPRNPGMVPAWMAGVHAAWTEALLRAGRRDEATAHFARAEKEYRAALRLGFAQGQMQSELGTLYALVGKPAEAVTAFEAAEAAGYVAPEAALTLARAYVQLGRCADAERVLTKLDQARGLTAPSRETRDVMGACTIKR